VVRLVHCSPRPHQENHSPEAARCGDAWRHQANDNAYLLQNYGPRTPVVFTHGKGTVLYDTEGKEYLDFAAGIAVNILGHSDPAWVAAVADQAEKLCHVSNLYHTVPGASLAKRLVHAADFADRVFFCNTGTEVRRSRLLNSLPRCPFSPRAVCAWRAPAREPAGSGARLQTREAELLRCSTKPAVYGMHRPDPLSAEYPHPTPLLSLTTR